MQMIAEKDAHHVEIMQQLASQRDEEHHHRLAAELEKCDAEHRAIMDQLVKEKLDAHAPTAAAAIDRSYDAISPMADASWAAFERSYTPIVQSVNSCVSEVNVYAYTFLFTPSTTWQALSTHAPSPAQTHPHQRHAHDRPGDQPRASHHLCETQ